MREKDAPAQLRTMHTPMLSPLRGQI